MPSGAFLALGGVKIVKIMLVIAPQLAHVGAFPAYVLKLRSLVEETEPFGTE
jgi:hypothetical protein